MHNLFIVKLHIWFQCTLKWLLIRPSFLNQFIDICLIKHSVISWKFINLQVWFTMTIYGLVFSKWLWIEFLMEVWDCWKIKVLFVDCFTCFLFVIMTDQIVSVPWLKSWYSIQLSKFSFIVNESNINLFGSGNFCRLISSKLFNSICLLIPISHKDSRIITVTDLMHFVCFFKKFYLFKMEYIYRR